LLNLLKTNEVIALDFDGIKVLAPSWVDEFLSGVKKNSQTKYNKT